MLKNNRIVSIYRPGLLRILFFTSFLGISLNDVSWARSVREVKEQGKAQAFEIMDDQGKVLKRVEKIVKEEKKEGHILATVHLPAVASESPVFGIIEMEEDYLEAPGQGRKTFSRKETFIFHDESGQEKWRKSMPEGRYLRDHVKFSKSGKTVAFFISQQMEAEPEGLLILDDMGKEIINLQLKRQVYDNVRDIVFSANGTYAAVVTNEGDVKKKEDTSRVRFYDLNSGKQLWEKVYGYLQYPQFIQISDDGTSRLDWSQKKLIISKDGKETDLYEGIDLTSLKRDADSFSQPFCSSNKKYCAIIASKKGMNVYGGYYSAKRWIRFYDLTNNTSWDWEYGVNDYLDPKIPEIRDNGDLIAVYKGKKTHLNKEGKEVQ